LNNSAARSVAKAIGRVSAHQSTQSRLFTKSINDAKTNFPKRLETNSL
jgi:hypothetical protein